MVKEWEMLGTNTFRAYKGLRDQVRKGGMV